MPKFKCEQYLSLRAYVDGENAVQFVDGEVEAAGDEAEALRALDDSYGVTEVKGGGGRSAR